MNIYSDDEVSLLPRIDVFRIDLGDSAVVPASNIDMSFLNHSNKL